MFFFAVNYVRIVFVKKSDFIRVAICDPVHIMETVHVVPHFLNDK